MIDPRELAKNACGALFGLALIGAAVAAPPAGGRAGAIRVDTAHLDLRPPATVPGYSAESPSFPSMRRVQALESTSEQQHPAFAAEAQVKARSTAEEFAQRVHREGIPVARLWENHSALLSLGLNQRGKPGLWLIQKIP